MQAAYRFIVLILLVAYTFGGTTYKRNDLNVTRQYNSTGTTCGGNCPSGGCSSCPCGDVASPQNIAEWCAQATNGWNQANCQCIMSHESGGNANAMHENSDGSVDVGLWQINDYNWDYCSNGAAPCDPAQNLACAMDVYMWGDNTWKFWVTCSTCGCCDSP